MKKEEMLEVIENITSSIYNEKYSNTDGGYPTSDEVLKSLYSLATAEELKGFTAEELKEMAQAATYEI